MSRYRNIHCLIWNDDKFPFVSDDCQLVFFHVLTTPFSNPLGIFKIPIEALSAEKRWPVKRYMKGFQEGIANGFWKYDNRSLLLYIPNFIKYNTPDNPNVIKSWAKIFNELPESLLKNEYHQSMEVFLKGLGEGFRKQFNERFNKPYLKSMPIQEQEQEQEQEQDCAGADHPLKKEIPYQEIIEYLNLKTGKKFDHTTKETRAKIKARWGTNGSSRTLQDFKTVIDNKCAKWLTDEKMADYLRPETLFSTKFESYLNEINPNVKQAASGYDSFFDCKKCGRRTFKNDLSAEGFCIKCDCPEVAHA